MNLKSDEKTFAHRTEAQNWSIGPWLKYLNTAKRRLTKDDLGDSLCAELDIIGAKSL